MHTYTKKEETKERRLDVGSQNRRVLERGGRRTIPSLKDITLPI